MKARLPNNLTLAVILFLVMLAGGATLYVLSLDSLLAARLNLSRQTALLHEARADLRQLPDRLALVRGAEADFRHMARLGFPGSGDRLDWVSALARTGQAMGMTGGAESGVRGLTWQLEPRQRHPILADLWVTPMTLRAAPLSASQVGDLLSRLADEAQGSFTVDTCSLAGGQGAGQADCRLLWWNWGGAWVTGPGDGAAAAAHGSPEPRRP